MAQRLGVSQQSLYQWIKARRHPEQRHAHVSQSEELRRLKAELKRVTEERNTLKKAAAYFAKQSGQSWITDITYIRTHEGWLYLAVGLDLSSRQVVGWSMGHLIDLPGVFETVIPMRLRVTGFGRASA